MPKKKSVNFWLAERDPAIRSLCEAIRSVILATAPQLEESIKWGNPVYTNNGNVFYISAADTYASLGFFNGAILTDPQHRIEGTGKKMRHVKVRAVEDMDVEQLESWVKEAVALDEADAFDSQHPHLGLIARPAIEGPQIQMPLRVLRGIFGFRDLSATNRQLAPVIP